MDYLLSANWAPQFVFVWISSPRGGTIRNSVKITERSASARIQFLSDNRIWSDNQWLRVTTACVSAAMSSLLHNGYVPKNVQWTWQFTTRPIRHPSFFLARTTWKGKNEKKHAIIHENKLLFLRVPPILTGSCRWCLVGWLLAPTRWFSALLCAMLVRMISTVFFTFFSLLKFLKGILNFVHALLVREMRSLGRLKSVALVGQQTSHFRNARWTGEGKFGHQQRL